LFVSVVGWLGLFLGLVVVALAALQWFLFDKFLGGPELDAQLAMLAGDPHVPGILGWLLLHVAVPFLALAALGAATIVAAIGVLRRRNWGRIGFLALVWLGVVVNVAGAALAMVAVQSIPADLAREIGEAGVDWQRLEFGLMALPASLAIISLSLHAWVIQRLSGREARREFGRE
jgi:hypothetical protein